MAEEQTITIEVDGRKLEARPGQMLIEVTDAAGISIPRFCYHKKLSIAANCRMCLVEVENAPKPLPACATPVSDGMKVWTCSPLAREAQKGTMEFLLINHPLDCPICDQGGECELQDLSMGYGRDVSRFVEGKRVVPDPDIGPLVATAMTRCIHCTRCVRFGEEIAGMRELGAVGRGEHTEIGTYVEKAMASELAGNVIDLCPVGALTSKPFRFRARPWEMTQHDGVAWHDGVGSNIHVHVRRGRVMRVVPRENESVNEIWISDRDRFSYQGLYSDDRLQQPLVRVDGQLKPVAWQQALVEAARLLKETEARRLGALVSPNATLEEMYLVRRLMQGLGSPHLDHRLRRSDFRVADPVGPWLGLRFEALESRDATLLVGSWLRKDQPLLNHRLRKSVLAGGVVMAINAVDHLFNYELAEKIICPPSRMVRELAAVAAALGVDTGAVEVRPEDRHQAMADRLKSAERPFVLLGTLAQMHPDFTLLRRLAHDIADAVGGRYGTVGDGANSTGAAAIGVLPGADGLHFGAMLEGDLEALLLVNLEPEFDAVHPAAMDALLRRTRVVALATFRSPWLEAHADVLLPMAAPPESSGSYLNLQGDLQRFRGVSQPPGEARPGWKILRVLGNLTDLAGFEYESSEEVLEALKEASDFVLDNGLSQSAPDSLRLEPAELERIGGVPIHSVDALVRRAAALQQTPDAWRSALRLHPDTAAVLGLREGDSAVLKQGEATLTLPVAFDSEVTSGCVWLPTGVPGSELLGEGFGPVSLEKA